MAGSAHTAFTALAEEEAPPPRKVYTIPPTTIIRLTGLVLLMDLIVTVVSPIAAEHYNMRNWWSDQLLHYSFVSSAIELLVLNIIRIICVAIACLEANKGFAMVKHEGVLVHDKYSTWAVKLCLTCVVVSGVKFGFSIFVEEGTIGAWEPSAFIFITCIVEGYLLWYIWKKLIYSAKTNLYEKLLSDDGDIEANNGTKTEYSMDLRELLKVLKPYFWPSNTDPYYRINRFRSVFTWVFIILSKIMNITSPIFIGNAVPALYDRNFRKAKEQIVIFALLALGGKVCKELQLVVYMKVKQEAYVSVAMASFNHIHKMSLQWHVKKKIGNLVRSIDRGNLAADNLVNYLYLFLTPTLFEIAMTVFVFFIKYDDWRLGLATMFYAWLYMYLTIKVTIIRMKSRKETVRHDNIYHDKITDSIVNYETVKYFTNEQNEAKWCRRTLDDFSYYQTSVLLSLSGLNIVQHCVMWVCIYHCLLMSVNSIMRGKYDNGALISINMYLAQVFTPLSFFGTVYNIITQSYVDIQSLTALLAAAPDVRDKPNAKDLQLPPHGGAGMSIEFENVSFNYPGQPIERGLRDMNFVVKPGTTTAFVGSTGSGKTTTARLMFRFYDPKKGRVLFNGQDIRKLKQKSVRAAIGVVPQDTVLFNNTIMHNISYGRVDANMSEIREAAEGAQILDFILSLPEQWETKVGDRGLMLSGGEKQRVAIARCLLKNPPVVLLDEATSALDSITESGVQEALQSLAEKRTTVVIAHRLSTIRNAEQICVVSAGSIIEMGTHDQLVEKKGVYCDMWEIQKQSGGSSDASSDGDSPSKLAQKGT